MERGTRAGRPSRRVVLVALATASVSACTADRSPPPPERSSGQRPDTPAPAPDDALRAAAADDARALAATYAAARSAAPALDVRLGPLAAALGAELKALTGGAPAPASTPPASPAAATTVLRRLRRAEEAAAERRLDDCERASDPGLARLLASLSAAGRARLVVLERT